MANMGWAMPIRSYDVCEAEQLNYIVNTNRYVVSANYDARMVAYFGSL